MVNRIGRTYSAFDCTIPQEQIIIRRFNRDSLNQFNKFVDPIYFGNELHLNWFVRDICEFLSGIEYLVSMSAPLNQYLLDTAAILQRTCIRNPRNALTVVRSLRLANRSDERLNVLMTRDRDILKAEPMLASAGSSPPREPSPTPLNPYKKRKHAALHAPSPAPSDSANPTNGTENVLLTARNDLFARPRLTISRVPHLVPIAEGSQYHTTEQITFNRIGFRYTPAGLAPIGSILPFRTIESAPTSFRVSWDDRSPFVKVTADGLGLYGEKGFRSARCNVPIREGRWYMEVKIEHGGGEHSADSTKREGSHVRLGWGRREAPLNGPVGLDGYSYGVRDKTGEKITLSRPKPYGIPFGSGDVVGMYISLPKRRQPSPKDPHDPAHIKRERIPI